MPFAGQAYVMSTRYARDSNSLLLKGVIMRIFKVIYPVIILGVISLYSCELISLSQKYKLTVVQNTYGLISITPIKSAYSDGDIVTISAIPNDGYSFITWTGDVNSNSNPLVISVNANTTVSARFEKNNGVEYSISCVQSDGGTYTIEPNKAKYSLGEQIKVSAIPNIGYTFVSWTGDISGINVNVKTTAS